MATDIGPELYAQIKRIFEKKYKVSGLESLRQKIESGEAPFEEMDIYAMETGTLISEALQEVLVSDALPDRRLFYELAEETLGETLKDAHYLIADVTAEIEEEMLLSQGLGIKPIKPPVNQSRIDGLLKIASDATDFDTVASSVLGEPVVNFALNTVDESVKQNAKFQTEAGLTVEVVRNYDDVGLRNRTQPCAWCLAREGTWDYEDALANGVFQRHEGCHCTITYTSRKGERSRSTGKWSGFSLL